MAVTRAGILSASSTFRLNSASESMLDQPRPRRFRFASDRRFVSACFAFGLAFGLEKNVWVRGLRCMVRVWVLRNPTKSVTFANPPRGNAEVSGRENRPHHSRRYDLPAHRALGAQHRRSPSYGRANIRPYVKSAFSASPATADELTHKSPALPQGTGCPRHSLRWNRRSAPSRSAAPLTKP
jgi:hypothetical protein